MNVQRTQAAAQSTGQSVRRGVGSATHTTKTAAQVGVAAVLGFVKGFLTTTRDYDPQREHADSYYETGKR